MLLLLVTSLLLTACATPKPPEKPVALSPAEIKIRNCSAALNHHYQREIDRQVLACVTQIAPSICLIEDEDCVADVVGFCSTSVRIKVQAKIGECAHTSLGDFLQNSKPSLLPSTEEIL